MALNSRALLSRYRRFRAFYIVLLASWVGVAPSPLCGLQLNKNETEPEFEVASVKQNKSGDVAPQRIDVRVGDRVRITNATLQTIIQEAYRLDVVGGPDWLKTDRFDINGKAEQPTSVERLHLMLRGLLADRFKLRAHREARRAPAYRLVLNRRDGRLGPNLRQAIDDCATLQKRAAESGSGGRNPCGSIGTPGRMIIHGSPIDQLAGMLSRYVDRKVIINDTGLTGIYDWDLTWTPEAFRTGGFDRDRFPSIDPAGPSLFTALKEQLGLMLQADTGETEVLMIDSIERPEPD